MRIKLREHESDDTNFYIPQEMVETYVWHSISIISNHRSGHYFLMKLLEEFSKGNITVNFIFKLLFMFCFFLKKMT